MSPLPLRLPVFSSFLFLIGALALPLGSVSAADVAADTTADAAAAAPEHPMPAPPAHPLFDRFKALEGTWIGTVTHGESGEPQPATATYELTAGGSALVETIFVGTPHEMVSVFFLDGDTLTMTHYCMAQVHPTMTASAGDDEDTVVLAFDSITEMPDPGAMHMNNAEFTFVDADHIQSAWNGYVGGQPVAEMCARLDLHRE